MPIISTKFLLHVLSIHENIQNKIDYPFCDPACVRYEALRFVFIDGESINHAIEKFGLSNYEFRKAKIAFNNHGVAGLIGININELIESLPLQTERMVFILKMARKNFPATKMVTILNGFDLNPSLDIIRRLYASYGWAQGTKKYKNIDFFGLNLKISMLNKLRKKEVKSKSFFNKKDRLQSLLEVFRNLGDRGINKLYPGSRVSFSKHKKSFLSIGLLGLINSDNPPFRNSKVGFSEEGKLIFSKIQKTEKSEAYFKKILEYKKINVDITCIKKIFKKWKVNQFQSKFIGDLTRFLDSDDSNITEEYCLNSLEDIPEVKHLRLDDGFLDFLNKLDQKPIPIAHPGIFLFLPYLNKLKIYENISTLKELDPNRGYSWFSILLINLGRILEGISSISKTCKTDELSLPIFSGLISLPCNDSVLNGLASIDEKVLLHIRQYLTKISKYNGIVSGKSIAFDFNMRDYTGEDIALKNIGKGPSPKRKICFPGFRPHIAWDVDTGAPISIEFRNGRARGTTTLKKYIKELLNDSIGVQDVEHIYLDSEYTAEHIWSYIVDSEQGLGADLTMCVKQNKKVKKYISKFMESNPTWCYYDDKHTYTEQTFKIPIKNTKKVLTCVLKRNEETKKIRCFGSTINNLTSFQILEEYRRRWTIENGIKDLCENYFLEKIPGIDPHRINIHYYMVTLARTLYEMLCNDYQDGKNQDETKRTLGTIRPEFMTGTNASLSRKRKTLVVKWLDRYPESKHKPLKDLFEKINREMSDELPFLGGLSLKFEISEPRSKELQNRLSRSNVEF